jgi:hypothetical protein
MTVWCLTEARNRGLKVNDKTLDRFREWSLKAYLKDPNLQPFVQDKSGGAKRA